VLIVASDAGGNASSNTYRLARGNRYQFAMSWDYDYYPPNYVTGYVSALRDDGLPTQTNLVSVSINGVGTTFTGTNGDGTVNFTTTDSVPWPSDGSLLMLNAVIQWADGTQDPGCCPDDWWITVKQTSLIDSAIRCEQETWCPPRNPDGATCELIRGVYSFGSSGSGPSGYSSEAYTEQSAWVSSPTVPLDQKECGWDGSALNPSPPEAAGQPDRALRVGCSSTIASGLSDAAPANEQMNWEGFEMVRVPFSCDADGWAVITFTGVAYGSPSWAPQDMSLVSYPGGTRVAPDSTSFLVQANPGDQLPLALQGPGDVAWTTSSPGQCGETNSVFEEMDWISFSGYGIGTVSVSVSPNQFTNYVCNAQNFNASGAPGTFTYSWSASDGATVYPSGDRNENAQILFTKSGPATVKVSAGPLPPATATGTILGPTNILHTTFATTPSNRNRTTIGVGEQVDLDLSPGCPNGNPTWSIVGADNYSPNGNHLSLQANGEEGNISVTATCCGRDYKVDFNVIKPSGISGANIESGYHYPVGTAGAGMLLLVTIAPTSVSFYRVNVMELTNEASSVTGYFTNFPPDRLKHKPDGWASLTEANQWEDIARDGGYSPPFSTGEYQWNISWKWYVPGWSEHSMPSYPQTFAIDTNGTMSVSKFGHTVRRTVNDVIDFDP
jgi:hypothetical protein